MWRKVARRPALSAILTLAVLAITVGGYLLAYGYRERRVASLLATVESDFDAADWSAEGLNRTEATIADLQNYAPEHAAAAHSRLSQHLAASIENQLRGATLPADVVLRTEAMLERLASRDAQRAEALREALQRRLRTWEPVFELTPPFASAEKVFDVAEITVNALGLAARARGDSKKMRTVCTRFSSAGTVRLEAVFQPSWQETNRLGLVLDADPSGTKPEGRSGYCFVLRACAPSETASGAPRTSGFFTFIEARDSGGLCRAEIFHQEDLLRSQEVEASRLPSGTLRLRVSSTEDQVQFEVGDLPPVDFQNTLIYHRFPARVFAVYWPPGMKLASLRAHRLPLPEHPSPLENGDAHYASERFAEALVAYEKQAESNELGEMAQQVRYKQAMCLLALGRKTEGEKILENLAGQTGHRWPALAVCQLWARYVQGKRLDRADDFFNVVVSRYRIEQLLPLIPRSIQREIIQGYCQQITRFNLYQRNPALVRRCARALEIAEYFNSEPDQRLNACRALVRAHMFAREDDEALRVATDGLRDADHRHLSLIQNSLLTDYLWLMRLKGRSQEALQELDSTLAPITAANPPKNYPQIIFARVQLLAALGRWEEAERALDELLRDAATDKPPPWCVTAWAMRGFLHERRGDMDTARVAWTAGLRGPWTSDRGAELLSGFVMASLTGKVAESDARVLLNQVLAATGDSFSLLARSGFTENVIPPATLVTVLKGTFHSPRARPYARKIVFQDMPFAEYVRIVPQLFGVEFGRQGAMNGSLTDEQETLLWKTSEDLYFAIFDSDTLSMPQLLQLGLTWKGTTSFLGWAGLSPTVKPELRGEMAYFLGHRYLRLGRPTEAVSFFETALGDAPADSALRKLAKAELDRLIAAGKSRSGAAP